MSGGVGCRNITKVIWQIMNAFNSQGHWDITC